MFQERPPMSNPFAGRSVALYGPALDIVPVVPNDSTDLANTGTALYVETGGQVRVLTVLGQDRTIAVADMSLLPVGIQRVFATGTTASGIHVLSVFK
jgi:hypothetical protein